MPGLADVDVHGIDVRFDQPAQNGRGDELGGIVGPLVAWRTISGRSRELGADPVHQGSFRDAASQSIRREAHYCVFGTGGYRHLNEILNWNRQYSPSKGHLMV